MNWKICCLIMFGCCIQIMNVQAQGVASRTEANIDEVQAIHGLNGSGVLTVMMDRGIDYRHPDFLLPNGNTRIEYIYDLYDNTGANDADNPFGVGTIHTKAEINAALQNGGVPIANDLFGHGTATTGIMSGNGSAVTSSDQFKGVATHSSIISIVVSKDGFPPFGNNPGRSGLFDANLLTYAFQFATLKISELDMPSVTLLNIGSIQDPTDGSLPICDMIDDYVTNGNTFVCGVGDDGGKDNHMIASLNQGQTTPFEIQKGEAGNLRFVGWYAENDRVELTITRPNGTIVGPFNPPNGPNDSQDEFLSDMNIYHRGADAEFFNSSSDLRMLLIDIFGETGSYTISFNSLDINSDGNVDAFLNPALYYNNNSFLNNTNPGGNINSISACPASISPGDYVATNTWTDINGIGRTRIGEGLPGELWIGSSIGPTMDGRLGIDLVAPGELAAAAYGNDSYYSSFEFNVLEESEGFYGLQTAVSAAAPITAGVIALMLEVNPMLTPDEIKMLLQESAREDSFTGTTPNVQWGHGKLDALAAVELAMNTVGVDDDLEQSFGIKIYPNPVDDFLTVEVADSRMFNENTMLSLHDITGKKINEYAISNSHQLDLSELASGIYVLRIKTGTSQHVKLITKN